MPVNFVARKTPISHQRGTGLKERKNFPPMRYQSKAIRWKKVWSLSGEISGQRVTILTIFLALATRNCR